MNQVTLKERPILFSGPMVRAILEGRKTQTRRIIKLPKTALVGYWEATSFGGPNGGRLKSGEAVPEQGAIWHPRTGKTLGCPYGQPGDRLWVRETWDDWSNMIHGKHLVYRADNPKWANGKPIEGDERVKWKPSIHMKRADSRIDLEVVKVRVERLQDISEEDAKAEGVEYTAEEKADVAGRFCLGLYGQAYSRLWAEINGENSWDANPWVWVIEFKRVRP